MSFIIKSAFIGLFILSCGLAFGGVNEEGVVTGRVVRFNKATVTLSQKGHHVTVSRKSIPKHIKLRIGTQAFALIKTRETASSGLPSKSQKQQEQKAEKEIKTP